MAARNLLKRDYVQLAHVYDPKKHSPAGWYASEKLDGQRAWWDGGVSRGKPAADVPYANTVKDARYVFPPTATGLWSRYGNVIYAPDWFLDALPGYCLDGELWSGRGNFQTNQATIKDLIPGPGWRNVRYMVFDVPLPSILFQDGDITVQDYKVYLRGCYAWWRKDYTNLEQPWTNCHSFEALHNYLCSHLKMTENLKVHTQWRLPFSTPGAVQELNIRLNEILEAGGEGIVLRKPSALWEPKRSYNSLKVKDFQDAEARVIGYTTGRETDKGSKLLGMMGALIVNFNGKRLELSGFKESERVFDTQSTFDAQRAKEWCEQNPGIETPPWIQNPMFPIGSQVTFRYRELTDDGIPKEARYWRKA